MQQISLKLVRSLFNESITAFHMYIRREIEFGPKLTSSLNRFIRFLMRNLLREDSGPTPMLIEAKKSASVICSSEAACKFPLAATPQHKRALTEQSGPKGTPQ